jgi:hypothetical protein
MRPMTTSVRGAAASMGRDGGMATKVKGLGEEDVETALRCVPG